MRPKKQSRYRRKFNRTRRGDGPAAAPGMPCAPPPHTEKKRGSAQLNKFAAESVSLIPVFHGHRSGTMDKTPRFGHAIRHWWPLDTDIDFLNPASFGATPHEILAAQSVWRDRMERNPMHFFLDVLPLEVRRQASLLAEFVGADADRLVFVENATNGVQAAIWSHLRERRDAGKLSAEREIITTDQVYPAVRNMMRLAAREFGTGYREIHIPFPLSGADEVRDRIAAELGERCALLVVDHVASPTGLVFPVHAIVANARERGVAVIVDGAHAPGMLPLDLDALDADWYVGNCHKWMFTPKSCALLYAAERRAAHTHPNVVSLTVGKGMPAEFDYVGTRDCTAFLCLEASLEFMRRLGIDGMRRYQSDLVAEIRPRFSAATGVDTPAPHDMTAGMLAFPLYGARRMDSDSARQLRAHCYRTRKFEVPFMVHDNHMLVRAAAQVFNEAGDYDALLELLSEAEFNKVQTELGWN